MVNGGLRGRRRSISIGLPAGVAARLDVQTGSGEVVSELPIDDRRTRQRYVHHGPRADRQRRRPAVRAA